MRSRICHINQWVKKRLLLNCDVESYNKTMTPLRWVKTYTVSAIVKALLCDVVIWNKIQTTVGTVGFNCPVGFIHRFPRGNCNTCRGSFTSDSFNETGNLPLNMMDAWMHRWMDGWMDGWMDWLALIGYIDRAREIHYKQPLFPSGRVNQEEHMSLIRQSNVNPLIHLTDLFRGKTSCIPKEWWTLPASKSRSHWHYLECWKVLRSTRKNQWELYKPNI